MAGSPKIKSLHDRKRKHLHLKADKVKTATHQTNKIEYHMNTYSSLPGWHKWTEFWGELIWWSWRWWAFHNCLQKLIKAWPALLIFRLHIRKPSYCTLKYYHAQTPNITAIIISAPTDSLWLKHKLKALEKTSIFFFGVGGERIIIPPEYALCRIEMRKQYALSTKARACIIINK